MIQCGDYDWIESDINSNALYIRERFRGIIECHPKIHFYDPRKLDALLLEEKVHELQDCIKKDPSAINKLTSKRNYVGLVTNGTSVGSLGDIGATAALPILESRSCLMSVFGVSYGMPVVLAEKDPVKFARLVEIISPTFGAIVMDEIKAPDCFEIEKQLKMTSACHVLHNGQHGIAIMVTAAIMNGLKLMNEKKAAELKVVINGCGSAGYAICKLLLHFGIKFIVVCDTFGTLYRNRLDNMNDFKTEIANTTNYDDEKGSLDELLKNANVYIGVEGGEPVKPDYFKMAADHMLFFLECPVPAMTSQEAHDLDANIVCTSSAQYPNTINSSMALNGILRAVIDGGVTELTLDMKLAAAKAVSNLIPAEILTKNRLLPSPLDTGKEVMAHIASAIIGEAIRIGQVPED